MSGKVNYHTLKPSKKNKPHVVHNRYELPKCNGDSTTCNCIRHSLDRLHPLVPDTNPRK